MCHKHRAIKKAVRKGGQRYYCYACQKWYTKTNKEKPPERSILIDHFDGIPYRKLAGRYGINKNKLCKITNLQTASFKPNIEITKCFLHQLIYSGNLVMDGKCVQVKEAVGTKLFWLGGKIPKSKKHRRTRGNRVIIWGIDYWQHDIPHFEFGESENGSVFNKYFYQLKSIGYPLVSLTVDGKKEIARAALRHYPDCVIQLCLKHYLDKINRELTVSHIKIKIEAREKQLDGLFDINDSDYLPVTRWWSIKRAVKLHNEIAELEFTYELLLEFQDIIRSIIYADDYEAAIRRAESLEKYFWPKRRQMGYSKEHVKIVSKLMTDFKEHQEYLLNYLKYSHLNIPHTTNMVEGLNSQIETRLNPIKGFEMDENAKNYVNAWVIKRRFTKYTDCKDPFKNLNGKTPLECAGADISTIRDWIKWCQK